MKNTLIAVCGLSPQVATETLYALHQMGKKIDAIRILTTRDGKEECLAQLFGNDDGHYFKYLAEYGYKPEDIDFNRKHIIALKNSRDVEVDDIDTEEENEGFLRLCMEMTFELTKNPQGSVYFSIAGGRKTMGACLTVAAQCYGRPQDRIYHVMVHPAEFEGCRDFFYPPKEPRAIEAGRWDRATRRRIPIAINTREAAITLVPMPFFSMRPMLSQEILRQPENPSSLLLSLVKEDKPTLVIDLKAKVVRWKGLETDLSPAQLAVYTLLAERKKKCRHTGSCTGCDQCFIGYGDVNQDELTGIYLKIRPNCQVNEMGKGGICSLASDNFRSYISRAAAQIEQTFGLQDANTIAPLGIGEKPGVRYGIALDKSQIEIRH